MCAHGEQYRAYWLDAFHDGYKSPAHVDQMIEDVIRSKANAIFVQMRRRADSYYVKSLEVPAQDATYSRSFDALQYIVERAHARGIEVHAWFIVYPLWPTTIAPPLDPDHLWHKHGPRAQGDDMWMSISSTGAIGGGLDPGHTAVQRYLAEVITDPIRHYDIDGVHLDYIRYSEDANYGWNPRSIERFSRLELRDGRPLANDPAWSDFRRRQVTEFVRQIYLRSLALKPSIKVSAALISWGNGPGSDSAFRATDAYARVFQDWRSWIEEGILDIAMPMHYFRDSSNASFLDRWLEFVRDRQFKRRYLPGLAIYLNPIADSISQIRRAITSGSFGSSGLGVSLYSYASTNTLNAAGLPIVPNSEFYQQAADLFGEDAKIPELEWKKNPATGHIMGWLSVDGGPEWLADGAAIHIASDTAKDFARSTNTSGAGFFGFVDLPPDRYRLRMERGGVTLLEATPRDVRAGAVTQFDLGLKAEDFANALPRPARTDLVSAAPGDFLTIYGSRLALLESYAPEVPLPVRLGGAQVLVNGIAAPLLSMAPGQVRIQLPYARVERWEIQVRHSGLESENIQVDWLAAHPVIVSLNQNGRLLEIQATGLGLIRSDLPAGSGADPNDLPSVELPARVLIGNHEIEPVFAGLMAYQPGRYQVILQLPEGIAGGTVRLRVGDALSNAMEF